MGVHIQRSEVIVWCLAHISARQVCKFGCQWSSLRKEDWAARWFKCWQICEHLNRQVNSPFDSLKRVLPSPPRSFTKEAKVLELRAAYPIDVPLARDPYAIDPASLRSLPWQRLLLLETCNRLFQSFPPPRDEAARLVHLLGHYEGHQGHWIVQESRRVQKSVQGAYWSSQNSYQRESWLGKKHSRCRSVNIGNSLHSTGWRVKRRPWRHYIETFKVFWGEYYV